MNAVALWGDHVGVGAQDIYVNYNIDWEEKRHFWLWNTALVFLSLCGGALMVQLRSASLWHNAEVLSPDLTSYTNHHPCGTPLDPLKVERATCFWGRRQQWGKKTGLSRDYLHRVTWSSKRLWAVRTEEWSVGEWLIERKERETEQESEAKKQRHTEREGWEKIRSTDQEVEGRQRWAELLMCCERDDQLEEHRVERHHWLKYCSSCRSPPGTTRAAVRRAKKETEEWIINCAAAWKHHQKRRASWYTAKQVSSAK